jgi:hypothetical protein
MAPFSSQLRATEELVTIVRLDFEVLTVPADPAYQD